MHRYIIFGSAGLGLLMYAIDSTVVAVAFPNFIKDFNTSVLWAAWTISIYLVAVTSVMPLMGAIDPGGFGWHDDAKRGSLPCPDHPLNCANLRRKRGAAPALIGAYAGGSA